MSQRMEPKYIPSSEASRLSQKYSLGKPLYEYKESVFQIGCSAAVLLIVSAFCIFLAIDGSNNPTNSSSTISGFAIVGGISVLIGLLALGVATNRSGNRLYACVDGFVYKQGLEEKVVLWENVKAIYQRIVEHKRRLGKYTTYTYTLEKQDGSRMTFNDNMYPMEGLCHYIEISMAARLLPKVIAEYEQGQNVAFGTLAVSKQGIFNGKEWLSWNEFDGVRFKNGYISVRKTGKWLNWASFFTPSIPNFTVLELLISHIEESRGQ